MLYRQGHSGKASVISKNKPINFRTLSANVVGFDMVVFICCCCDSSRNNPAHPLERLWRIISAAFDGSPPEIECNFLTTAAAESAASYSNFFCFSCILSISAMLHFWLFWKNTWTGISMYLAMSLFVKGSDAFLPFRFGFTAGCVGSAGRGGGALRFGLWLHFSSTADFSSASTSTSSTVVTRSDEGATVLFLSLFSKL